MGGDILGMLCKFESMYNLKLKNNKYKNDPPNGGSSLMFDKISNFAIGIKV